MAKAQKENWASPGTYPEWAQRIRERPGVAAALKMEDRTDPRLRTFTGEARG